MFSSRIRLRFLIVSMLLPVFLLFCAPRALASLYGVSIDAGCSTAGYDIPGSSHSYQGSGPLPPLDCAESSSNASAHGTATGFIDIGTMGVVLSSGATSIPAINGAVGGASVNASWWDTLTFTAPVQGETVQYRLTATVHGSMTCGGETGGTASFQISWGQATTLYFSDDNCSGKLAGTQSAIATFAAGQSATIGGLLLSSVRAEAGNGCCGSYILASENNLDAGDTFALTITPLTPGASYTRLGDQLCLDHPGTLVPAFSGDGSRSGLRTRPRPAPRAGVS